MAEILIVDDEPETVELLARIIKLLGHQPLEAGGFQSAMSFLELGMPDLILLDLMMPEVDGFETLKRIRAMPEGQHVPIVVVTASPEVNLEEKISSLGGDGVYHKPISMAILTEAIDKHLSQGDTAPLSASATAA